MEAEKKYEPRKLFIGGLPRDGVSKEALKGHFARYGNVVDALVAVFRETGVGRGFGFVEFEDEDGVARALKPEEKEKHVFNGRRVDVKRAERRDDTRSAQAQTTTTNPNADAKKIFVGGLGDNVTKEDLTDYFEKFGIITDAVVITDKLNSKPRGFGFVTFDSKEATDKVLESRFHDLNGKKVETKNAEPRGRCNYGHYHGSMARGQHWTNNFSGIYSPQNMPYVPYSASYMPHPYTFFPRMVNYGCMVNQASNDSSMIPMPRPPWMSEYYGSSYVYDPLSNTHLGQATQDIGNDSKVVKGNQQRVVIRAPTGMKSDPDRPDSNNLP